MLWSVHSGSLPAHRHRKTKTPVLRTRFHPMEPAFRPTYNGFSSHRSLVPVFLYPRLIFPDELPE